MLGDDDKKDLNNENKKTKSIIGALSLRSKIKAPPTQVHVNKKRKAIANKEIFKKIKKNAWLSNYNMI